MDDIVGPHAREGGCAGVLEQHLARFRGGAQQVERAAADAAGKPRRRGEVVVARRPHRIAGGPGAGSHQVDGQRRAGGVPGARREVETHGVRRRALGIRHREVHRLGLADHHLAERHGHLVDERNRRFHRLQVRSAFPAHRVRLRDRDIVLSAGAQVRKRDAFAGRRAVRGAATHNEPRASGDVAVAGHRDAQVVFFAAAQDRLVRTDLERWRGRPADHRPRQRRPRRDAVDAVRRHFRPVGSGRRIADDDPLDVVLAGARRVLAACAAPTVRAGVEPQVQVVQHHAPDGFRRRLVPSEHQVQAAGAGRNHDVLPSVFAAPRLAHAAAAQPTVGGVAVQHAGVRRHLAEAVLAVQFARAAAVVRRESSGRRQPGIGLDRAGHQARPHQRRLPLVRGRRIHQQGGHAGHRRRGHAGAAGDEVAVLAAVSLRRAHQHARRHHLRRQSAVGRGPAGTEQRQLAVVAHRAHGQGVLRRAVARETVNIRVALHCDIELAMRPNDAVELALFRVHALEQPAVGAQAHVHDERHPRCGCAGATRRGGEVVHAAHDAERRAAAVEVQHLGEADVPNARGDAGEPRVDIAVAEQGAGNVGSVAVAVQPQIGIVLGRHGAQVLHVAPANAPAVAGNVQVVEVQARVHDANGHGRAGGAEERARRTAVVAQAVRAHGRHGQVVRGAHHAHRMHCRHEVRRGDGAQRRGARIGGVDADVRPEAAHRRPHALERAPPATVRVVRHQRDEHRRLFAGGSGQGVAGHRHQLAQGGHRAQRGDERQRRDAVQPFVVRRQPDARQVPRRAQHFPAMRAQGRGDGAWRRVLRQPKPAERPIPLRAVGLAAHQRERFGGAKPFHSGDIGFLRRQALVQRQWRFRHRQRRIDERKSVRRRWRGRRDVFCPDRGLSRRFGSRCDWRGLARRRRESAAFRADLLHRRVQRALFQARVVHRRSAPRPCSADQQYHRDPDHRGAAEEQQTPFRVARHGQSGRQVGTEP